jgi:tRNA(Ile)-lysidine synthase
VAERAKASGEGIEAAARRFRYAALRRSADSTGAAAVLLAHTRDDQLETLLMRLFAGSGAAGLRGIPAVSGLFLRPFLSIGKDELLSYLESRGRGYSTDSTNESGDYLRNRIRRELVPVLDSTFGGWRRGLARAARKAERDEEALGAAAGRLAFSPRLDGSMSAPAASLLEAPDSIAVRALVEAAGRLLGRTRVSSDMAASALEALRRGGPAGYRGSGLELRAAEGEVLLRRLPDTTERGGLDFPRRDGYFVIIHQACRIRVGALELRASWRSKGDRGIREEAFRFPLVVRSRRPGDRIALEAGTKRLDALFSEWGLPDAMRGVAPVIEDRDGIVAVLGAGIGGKDRYRAIRAGGEPSGELGKRFTVIVKGA